MNARLAILLSGGGSTYANLVEAIADGRLAAEIAVVISSRRAVQGVQRANDHGHPVFVTRDPAEIARLLATHEASHVAMCGWTRYWDPPPQWQGKVVNIHPSLLPSFGGRGFYGHHVHAAVLAQGCKLSGCTAHLVQGDYDTGPILAQEAVPVYPHDTVESLADRVQALERAIYPGVVQALVSNRIREQDGRYWIED